ncbi:MAG: Mfa1 family fimbria major subunit [Muribaculaceae bacterium]|nr:Mfa1 family fimbria major subunit [Muribaculaceae bacterium]
MRLFTFPNPKGLLYIFMAIIMVGCVDVSSEPDNPDEDRNDRYLLINISETGGIYSRADYEFDSGTIEENAINDISFYLFKSDGSPYLMYQPGESSGESSNRVVLQTEDSGKGMLSMLLILGNPVNMNDGGLSRLIAVANLGNEGYQSSFENLSMTDFSKKIIKLHPQSGNGIIMTSSTYFDGENRKIFWTDIAAVHLQSTPGGAKENPVTVNLERIMAKVTVNVTPTSGAVDSNGRFKVARKVLVGKDNVKEEKELFAEVLGWDLNATSNQTSLIKNVIPEKVPFASWNHPSLKRSYWAEIPSGTAPAKSFNWDGLSRSIGSSAYCYENTLQPKAGHFQDATTDATKVLIKARITDSYGTPQDMVSLGGVLYETPVMKRWIAEVADPEGKDEGKVRFVRREETGRRHVVEAYYEDTKVEGFDNLRHWEDGACYYVANLRHAFTSSSDTSEAVPVYGVVRNHSYMLNISSIAGLGTPGGKDDHDTPENPERQIDTTVKADVVILPWHLMSFDVDVET